VLDEMQITGYNSTELGDWGFMPNEATTLRAEILARNLEMLGAFGQYRSLLPALPYIWQGIGKSG